MRVDVVLSTVTFAHDESRSGRVNEVRAPPEIAETESGTVSVLQTIGAGEPGTEGKLPFCISQ